MVERSRIILNFHGLGAPHADVPESERPYWLPVDRFAGIIEEIVARRAGGADIALTFDDGNRSDLEIAVPYLVENGLVAAFFVLTGRLGDSRYLSRSDVTRLRDLGMDIGLHGRNHVDWRRLDEAGRADEIPRSRAELEDLAGEAVRSVSIPFGAYDRRLMSYLKRQDFDTIYTSDGGRARIGDRVQPRTSLRSDMSGADLAVLLEGRSDLAGRVRRGVRRMLKEHVI